MLDDAFVLQCMRYRARSQRYIINVRCPKPEDAEGFVRSSDSPSEPEWPEELKAQHRRLWPSLSSLEQQLLANWRAKHFESNGNGTPASDSGCAVEQINSKQHAKPSQQLWKLLRVVEAEGAVCTENLVRFDLMTESLNVGRDGRIDIFPLEPGRVVLQAQELA